MEKYSAPVSTKLFVLADNRTLIMSPNSRGGNRPLWFNLAMDRVLFQRCRSDEDDVIYFSHLICIYNQDVVSGAISRQK